MNLRWARKSEMWPGVFFSPDEVVFLDDLPGSGAYNRRCAQRWPLSERSPIDEVQVKGLQVTLDGRELLGNGVEIGVVHTVVFTRA
jgi:hypothetical protein